MNSDSTGQRYPNWMPTAGGISALIASRILGFIALVLIALSRKEFE